jgi:hypothetical protein
MLGRSALRSVDAAQGRAGGSRVSPDQVRDQYLSHRAVVCASKPGLAPAGEALFFASPKKKYQKKGDPMVRVLPLRSRQPAVLAENGVELELAFGSNNRSP